MVIRLLAFIVLMSSPFVVAGVAAFSLIRPRIRERRARLAAIKRAELTCLDPDCAIPIDTDALDVIYDSGHWMHRQCRQKLLSPSTE
jgi:hypothetical protein